MGKNALRSRLDVREADPLPEKCVNEYARTKLLAEKLVDQAARGGLPVVTLRPRAIFGPGDRSILPRVVDRLERGQLPLVGDGQNLIDLTYIDNVVDALLLAASAPSLILGKKYNISNGERVKLWEQIQRLCAELGLVYPTRRLPYPLADLFARGLEILYKLIPGQPEPPLTRYTAALLAMSTTLDISAARAELGYEPRVPLDEGLKAFAEWWTQSHLRRAPGTG